ncbi:hypothetical protein OAE85_01935, partial [Akkermansiaceae bacterium]|nr:hypothetical protein [Akkermansiaceae bacterium]
MKKLLQVLPLLFCSTTLYAEDSSPDLAEKAERSVYVVRYIQVAKENVAAYEAALAEKTQKFNVG